MDRLTTNANSANLLDRYALNASWLIRLRWVAVVGQILTVVSAVTVFDVEIAWAPLVVIIGVTAFSNLVLDAWFRKRLRVQNSEMARLAPAAWDLILGLVMTMDMISLTVLLFVTGGVNNPFCFFFFVNLSLSAVVLSRNWAWALNSFSILGFGWLLLDFWSIDHPGFGISLQSIREIGRPTLQHAGLLASFATCSSVITYFMVRLTSSLQQQEQDLRLAQQAKAKAEKLEALGTLAAGAAHELASPLSTIAIVAKELETMILASPQTHDEDVLTDVRLMRSQVDRCRKILDRMAGHAGQTVGETPREVTVEVLWQEVVDGLPEVFRGRVTAVFSEKIKHQTLVLPFDAICQSIRGIVHNAIEVEPADSQVKVTVSAFQEPGDKGSSPSDSLTLLWKIQDNGPGMDPTTLSRVSEPFFTTKPPGQGMGLGVFLASSVIERLGGKLEFKSSLGKGTIVNIYLYSEHS
ncbi:MAG TPA: ATP-binding protein [Pirellulaceae bacterium]|nr:ATP-binding protein [Pirellulaceae bacterium]HMO93821.1 ATP-binding protein [Pirellulaceae bacterium]HMP70680.1 ATP-binding protein [Pirellulaceae bacterium]